MHLFKVITLLTFNLLIVGKNITIFTHGQDYLVRKACERSIFLFHRQLLFATLGKKKGVNQLCCYNLGIAKHLYTYNSEAHTRRRKHSLSTAEAYIRNWRFQVVHPSRSKHFLYPNVYL